MTATLQWEYLRRASLALLAVLALSACEDPRTGSSKSSASSQHNLAGSAQEERLGWGQALRDEMQLTTTQDPEREWNSMEPVGLGSLRWVMLDVLDGSAAETRRPDERAAELVDPRLLVEDEFEWRESREAYCRNAAGWLGSVYRTSSKQSSSEWACWADVSREEYDFENGVLVISLQVMAKSSLAGRLNQDGTSIAKSSVRVMGRPSEAQAVARAIDANRTTTTLYFRPVLLVQDVAASGVIRGAVGDRAEITFTDMVVREPSALDLVSTVESLRTVGRPHDMLNGPSEELRIAGRRLHIRALPKNLDWSIAPVFPTADSSLGEWGGRQEDVIRRVVAVVNEGPPRQMPSMSILLEIFAVKLKVPDAGIELRFISDDNQSILRQYRAAFDGEGVTWDWSRYSAVRYATKVKLTSVDIWAVEIDQPIRIEQNSRE